MITLPYKLLLLALHLSLTHTKMMRNDALISKMVSNFHKDNQLSTEPRQLERQLERQKESTQPKNVLSLMQSVLCKNFPTIPCEMITEDETLRKLIEKSIQQIKYKKLSMDKTTPLPPGYLTLFPVINSEDLSNFLQVSETGYYKYKQEKDGQKKRTKKSKTKSNEKEKKSKHKGDPQRSPVYGRKKIRKFYPHKIKYKDKRNKTFRKDFGDYSDDKLSMSVEIPDGMNLDRNHLTYRVEPADPPVWRIDYMKHGDPSLNSMFGYEADRLKTKLIKTGPNVILDDNVVEPRKDVLHPDVYIKKNFFKKNIVDSGGLD